MTPNVPPAPRPTLPTTDAEAIAFALDNLEPWEVVDFLHDWRKRRDMTPWLNDPSDDWVIDNETP